MNALPVRSRTERLLFQAIADLFEWLAVVLLALLNLLLLSQSAGFGPEPLLPAIFLCAGMVLCHAFWQVLDRTPCALRLHPMALWLLPLWGILIVYALFSPAPWQAQYEATVATIALIAFWVGAHHLRAPGQMYALLVCVAAPLAVAILFALLQGLTQMQGQAWILDLAGRSLYRPESDSAAQGVASGLFDSPRAFAAFLALCLPVIAAYALPVRLPAAARLALLALGWFTACALVLTHVPSALAVGALATLVTPWVARSRDLPLWLALLLVAAMLASAFVAVYLLSPPTRVWVDSGLAATIGSGGLITGGWHLFTANPLFGAGIGNFANAFEAYRPVGFVPLQVGAPPPLIKLLAEAGLVGTLIGLGLAGWFLVRLFTRWRLLPNAVKTKDEEIELAGRRYCQPLATVSAGAALMAAFTAAALLLCGNPLEEPALIVLLCSLLGLGVAQLPLPFYWVKERPHSGYVLTAIALALAALLPLLTLAPLASRLYARQAEQALRPLQALDPLQLQEAQPALRRQQYRLEQATRLAPDNAPAWVSLSGVYLLQMRTQAAADRPAGTLAGWAAAQALHVHPSYLPAWLMRAQTEQTAGTIATAEACLQKAIEYAPYNAYCWYRLADLLKQNAASRDKALEAINRSLELDPANQLAQQVQRQLLIP